MHLGIWLFTRNTNFTVQNWLIWASVFMLTYIHIYCTKENLIYFPKVYLINSLSYVKIYDKKPKITIDFLQDILTSSNGIYTFWLSFDIKCFDAAFTTNSHYFWYNVVCSKNQYSHFIATYRHFSTKQEAHVLLRYLFKCKCLRQVILTMLLINPIFTTFSIMGMQF